MGNLIISALMQVLVFALIPVIVYLVAYRKTGSFFQWVGLKKANTKSILYSLLLMLFIATPILMLASIDEGMKQVLFDEKSVSGNIKSLGFGWESVLTLLITAVIKTGFSEELFFRGFLAKRLISILGYQVGNWVQAIIFGAIHTLLFLNITDSTLFLTIIFFMPTIGAYLKTHINEKLANGSILPSWIAHASGNILAYSIIAFVL